MVEEREELECFLESLEMDDNAEDERMTSEGDCCRGMEQSLMQQKMLRIRKEAEMSIEKLQDLQGDIDHLAENNEHLEAELAQKNSQLDRQSYLLRSIHMELIDQKRKFQDKLAEYSDLFQGMWQKQSADIQRQEQVQRNQLSEMLENICLAMQRWCQRKAALMSQEDEGLESRKSPVEVPKL